MLMRFTWSHFTGSSCIKTETSIAPQPSNALLLVSWFPFHIQFSVMPPKKTAADSANPPVSSASDTPVGEKKPDAAVLRKLATHPSTAVMMKEALKELDSRKGVSSQAIQAYIKQKYPSVDLVRLKHLVCKALKKGIETGTLVRPANSTVTTGATGKFRLAPKVKEAKPKTENVDPNVLKEAKDGAKKPKKAGTAKKKDKIDEENESKEESKPPKKSKKEKEAATADPTTSSVAPAKKPKARKAAEKEGDGASDPAKTKAAKTTRMASRSKAAKAGSDAPAAKATGKRGRKKAE
ncbi:linker histone H1M [Anarrhichthys ocellatus]|uniref:linker histone H1M n=1 Tax=Anarrhichthys ocellatus TaxID=433405 RepID=UPI0012EE181D|nr:protein B4-like [Anarrhichthys ocellatus]